MEENLIFVKKKKEKKKKKGDLGGCSRTKRHFLFFFMNPICIPKDGHGFVLDSLDFADSFQTRSIRVEQGQTSHQVENLDKQAIR